MTRNLFANRYITTIGCDFYVKTIDVETSKGTENYKLLLLDIGGQLELRDFRLRYMDSAEIVLVVFALNDPGSFDVDEFIEDIFIMPPRNQCSRSWVINWISSKKITLTFPGSRPLRKPTTFLST